MRPCRLIVAAGLATALALGTHTTEATADPRPPSGAGAYVDEADNPTAVAQDGSTSPGRSGSSGGSGNPNISCTTQVWYESEGFMVYETEGVPQHSPTGRWFTRICRDNTTGAVTEQVLPEAAPADPVAVALQALQSVTIPEPPIATSPRPDDLVVRVPTWLWVDPGWWRPYSASATAGAVTATVTAQPSTASWSMGDGTTVVCHGPGVPWAPGMPETGTNCTHTYTSSSLGRPGHVFSLGLTVELTVTWTSNVGASGSLDPISRGATQPVHVGEIQAIETR